MVAGALDRPGVLLGPRRHVAGHVAQDEADRGADGRVLEGGVDLRAGDRPQRAAGQAARTRQDRRPKDAVLVSTPGSTGGSFSLFEHLLSRGNADVVKVVARLLIEAEAFYKQQAIRALAAVHWPSVFLHFPEDVAVYVGADPKQGRTALARVVWAAFTAAVSLILFLLRRKIEGAGRSASTGGPASSAQRRADCGRAPGAPSRGRSASRSTSEWW